METLICQLLEVQGNIQMIEIMKVKGPWSYSKHLVQIESV